jgi:hypothetical protein
VKPWRYLVKLIALFSLPAFGADILPPGHRPIPPAVHALVGGKVVVKPGQIMDGATIVIRDGFIQAVGSDLTPPADARVWEMKGATIYAGFIDPYLRFDSTNPPVNLSSAARPV